MFVATGFAPIAASAKPPFDGLTIAVERVFGFVAASSSANYGGDDEESSSTTSFGLGLYPSGGQATAFSVPRVGVDLVLPPGLSFGSAIGYATLSNDYSLVYWRDDIDERQETSASTFLIAPRIGILLAVVDGVAVWPRAGISYVNISAVDAEGDELSAGVAALSLEAPVVFGSGVLGFVVSPTMDWGLSISTEVDGYEVNADRSLSEFGIQCGLMGRL